MVSSSIEDELSSHFLKKKKKKGNIGPIRMESSLLIKEKRDYPGRFKVYFRTSVAQFDALLVILEPHIKKKTTNFCELSVQGSIYSALCCETKWINLTIAILDFGVRLYGGSELSKHLSKWNKCSSFANSCLHARWCRPTMYFFFM